MSNTFEFADRLGFSPPMQFTNEDNNDIALEVQAPDAHLRIQFMSKSYYINNYEGTYITDIGPKDFLVLARKNKDVEQNYYAVEDFNKSGLTYRNIPELFHLAIGIEIVENIRQEKTQATAYVNQFLDWLGLPPSQLRSSWEGALLAKVTDYINHFEKATIPNGFNELHDLFKLCLELSIIDLSNTAGFIAEEIFFALAKQIRAQKLERNRWDATLGDDEYKPLIKALGKDAKLPDFLEKVFEQPNNDLPKDHKFSVEDLKKIDSLPTLIYSIVKRIAAYFKQFIGDLLKQIKDDGEEIIKLYNAYVVGFINGVIDFIASVVEGIGFMIGLLNYDTQQALVDGVSKFIDSISWQLIKEFIKKNLKDFFKYMNSAARYEKAYDLGALIPRLLEIAIDVALFAKGTVKVARRTADIIKQLPELRRQINERIKEMRLQTLLNLDKDIINRLKEKGIEIDIEPVLVNPLEGRVGTYFVEPDKGSLKKLFDGNIYTVRYGDVELKSFRSEKEAKSLLKETK